jgi:excinuclease ABC subunit C
MIREDITIKNGLLPDEPGVYFYFDVADKLLYIGKATSLKKRVGSYFTKSHDNRITELVTKIARIDYIQTPTVIEALVLEANQIKLHQPPVNIMQKDGKSFLYLVITNDMYPRPVLIRGKELEEKGINPFSTTLTEKAKEKYLAVFGPYTSGPSLKKALDYVRRMIPWSTCRPPEETGKHRPCFDRHIRKCPGVCTGEISVADYKKIVRKLMYFFEGKKGVLVKELTKDMKRASKDQNYELAAKLRNQIFALEHIQDVAVITKDDVALPYEVKDRGTVLDLDGRIEAYDISNISGTSSVGSMVVFEHGIPAKAKYRKFKIKTVDGANDVGSMEEVMRRRLKRYQKFPNAWPLPVLMVIDGGKPQVNRVQAVLDEMGIDVPIVGLAKGLDRKQDRMVFDRSDLRMLKTAPRGREIFQKIRDEAHRFAVKYHRQLRTRASGIIKRKK